MAVGILFGGSSIAALQGDIILAHHDATIGFFGPKLSKSLDSSMDKPNKFKTAEYAYHHGLLDGVINKDMAPDLLIKIISTVTKTTMGGATKVTSPPEFTRQDGWSCVKLSRSGDQPSVRQTINALCDSFVDLHGDRMEGDDPAIIGGIGNIAGKPVILVGHNTPKNNLETQVRAHFGMPHAYGLRKAVRLIELGDQLNYPIITMIDSPGMFVDVSNESVGIAGWAGTLMRSMISVSVPTVGLILGEGASGSALVFALTDRLIMNDRSWFGVIAPESAAKLVWKEDKNMKQTKEMAEALKLDPGYMLDNHITDQVIQWI